MLFVCNDSELPSIRYVLLFRFGEVRIISVSEVNKVSEQYRRQPGVARIFFLRI